MGTGVKANVVIAELAAAHAEGKTNAGFDIDSDSSSVAKEDGTKHTFDAVEKQIFDLLMAKHWGLKYATNAASTILRVDQIIMAKRAGGPKARPGQGPMDQDDGLRSRKIYKKKLTLIFCFYTLIPLYHSCIDALI